MLNRVSTATISTVLERYRELNKSKSEKLILLLKEAQRATDRDRRDSAISKLYDVLVAGCEDDLKLKEATTGFIELGIKEVTVEDLNTLIELLLNLNGRLEEGDFKGTVDTVHEVFNHEPKDYEITYWDGDDDEPPKAGGGKDPVEV